MFVDLAVAAPRIHARDAGRYPVGPLGRQVRGEDGPDLEVRRFLGAVVAQPDLEGGLAAQSPRGAAR